MTEPVKTYPVPPDLSALNAEARADRDASIRKEHTFWEAIRALYPETHGGISYDPSTQTVWATDD